MQTIEPLKFSFWGNNIFPSFHIEEKAEPILWPTKRKAERRLWPTKKKKNLSKDYGQRVVEGLSFVRKQKSLYKKIHFNFYFQETMLKKLGNLKRKIPFFLNVRMK